MRVAFYICYISGLFLLIIGILLSLAMESCYDKTPTDFFNSKVCTTLVRK